MRFPSSAGTGDSDAPTSVRLSKTSVAIETSFCSKWEANSSRSRFTGVFVR